MRKLVVSLLLLSAGLSPVAALAAGDPVKGKTVYARCMACHKVDKSGTNGLGPNLYAVIGRPVASAKGFNYSPAMKKVGGKWTAKTLDGYITAPAKAVPGNRMMFAGVPNPADRENLLAYLESASK